MLLHRNMERCGTAQLVMLVRAMPLHSFVPLKKNAPGAKRKTEGSKNLISNTNISLQSTPVLLHIMLYT